MTRTGLRGQRDRRVLALDLGSSSARAIVYEPGPRGPVQVPGALARRPRSLRHAEPGEATFDADDYLADVVACLDELHAGGFLEGVGEVAVACQWHSLLAVDRRGEALGPVLTWADTRPELPARLAHVTSEAAERLRQRTGCALHPLYWTCRAAWLRQHGLGAGDRLVGLAEYLGLQLLGDGSMSASMASGTGLLATASRDWDDEAVDLAAVEVRALPPLAPAGWRGHLTGPWRQRWPALSGAHWHPALGDGAAANLGTGCHGPGRAAVTVGTSAAVRAARLAPAGQGLAQLAPGLWRYCAGPGLVVEGAAFSGGGQLYAWALSLWQGRSAAEVSYDVDLPVGPGSDGVLVMPWHSGARPPEPAMPAGRGMVLGLGLGAGGAHVVSATVEAVCFQLAGGLEALEGYRPGEPGAVASRSLEVVAGGGAVERSGLWRRRLAATLARPVTYVTERETTARGAAAAALGNEVHPEGAVLEPAEADVKALREAAQLWRERYLEMSALARRPT